MFNQTQQQVIQDFIQGVHADKALDEKTRHMVKLSAAAVLGCYPCMEDLLGSAREKGLSPDEVGAVLLTAMFVAAGATKNKALEVYETRVKNR